MDYLQQKSKALEINCMKKRFETRAIRLQNKQTAEREHSVPIFPTSSFTFDNAEQMRAVFANEETGNIYSRFTNPNCRELETKIASLEETEDAVALASGMSAVFGALMGHLQAGDHLLCARAVFGSTYQVLMNWLPRWGIETSFVDGMDAASWTKAIKTNTKMFFLETPSNPGLAIIDLAEVGSFCKSHELLMVVDNCFATPYLQRPINFGAHLVTHSATKFIDGQGRVVGGLVAGKSEHLAPVQRFLRNTGPALSPFNAWILSKSLETLAVRMDRHCANALALAKWMEDLEMIKNVRYPFLSSHPGSTVAKKQMDQGGGLLTFEMQGGLVAGKQFLDNLQLCSLSANLGDTRTIVTHPASTTHNKLSPEDRQKVGITDGLIRVSVGLEHMEDLKTDLLQSLKKINL